MRILSSFHDYYDAAQSLGQDRSLVFLRETIRYEDCRRKPTAPPHLQAFVKFGLDSTPSDIEAVVARGCRLHVRFGVLLFAGALMPWAAVTRHRKSELSADAPVFFFARESLREDLALDDYDLDEVDSRRQKGWIRWRKPHSTKTFFALAQSERMGEYALCHHIAILNWDGSREELTVNPRLEDLQLFRHLNTWQAFQQLAQFNGNLAAPDRTPVNVADRDRIVQHGFDKYSFRKLPEKP